MVDDGSPPPAETASSDSAARPDKAPRSGHRRRRRRSDGQRAAESREALTPVEQAARRLGITRLYPEQEQVIHNAVAGTDTLVVLPTGFGKSACYQIPSMIMPNPVVVISPLLALLRDQHEKLIKRRVPCVRLDGTV